MLRQGGGAGGERVLRAAHARRRPRLVPPWVLVRGQAGLIINEVFPNTLRIENKIKYNGNCKG